MSDPALSAEQSATSALTPINSELRGALSKTLSRQGRDDFALLLAMLHQDINYALRKLKSRRPIPESGS